MTATLRISDDFDSWPLADRLIHVSKAFDPDAGGSRRIRVLLQEAAVELRLNKEMLPGGKLSRDWHGR